MRLNEIQQKLKAPKNQRNNFGNYNYRNAEDILEAVKPLLGDGIVTLSDDIVQVGDRFYVKATATFYEQAPKANIIGGTIQVTAFARESLDKKGMDSAQITGAASSYARKYALNGLFLIDDTKDADTQDNTAKSERAKPYRVERVVAEDDEEAGHVETPVIQVQTLGEMKKEIAALLKQKADFIAKGKKIEEIDDKVRDLTGITLVEANYAAIIEELKSL